MNFKQKGEEILITNIALSPEKMKYKPITAFAYQRVNMYIIRRYFFLKQICMYEYILLEVPFSITNVDDYYEEYPLQCNFPGDIFTGWFPIAFSRRNQIIAGEKIPASQT